MSRPLMRTHANVKANSMDGGEEKRVNVRRSNVQQTSKMTENVVAAAVTRGDAVKENLDGNGSLVA